MKATILLFSLLVGILPIAAQGEEPAESPIVGTWCWRNIRHNLEITFNADGTYEQEYSEASDEENIDRDTGTWSLEGSTLTMSSSRKGSEPAPSSVQFFGKDRFDLDGFRIFDRILGAQTQKEMNQDAADEFKAADTELNSIYQKILEDYADDKAFITSLKDAQRCWIVFRDAQLKMKYPDREPGYYGSIQPVCEMTYLTELTQDRIKALNVWIEGVQEGDTCAGTVKVKE